MVWNCIRISLTGQGWTKLENERGRKNILVRQPLAGPVEPGQCPARRNRRLQDHRRLHTIGDTDLGIITITIIILITTIRIIVVIMMIIITVLVITERLRELIKEAATQMKFTEEMIIIPIVAEPTHLTMVDLIEATTR